MHSSFLLLAVAAVMLNYNVDSLYTSKLNYRHNLHQHQQQRHVHKSMNARNNAMKHQMFSGIVEEIGTIDKVIEKDDLILWDGSIGKGVEFSVNGNIALKDAYIGCSIAVNGVCLTATSLTDNTFTVGIAPETLRRSNLGSLSVGSKVNLERAMKADGRNSGHFVQGHVDTTGAIIEKFREKDSLWIKVKVSVDVMRYIVEKGFIAIDGTSLTICQVNKDECWFTFMLISHTQQNVVIPMKEIGDYVNIEVDVLAKMVEQSLIASLKDKYVSKEEYNKLLNRVNEIENAIKAKSR